MKAQIFTTNYEKNQKLAFDGTFDFEVKNTDVVEGTDKSGDIEQCLVNVHPDVEYHTFFGFGGAFTETSAVAFGKLSPQKQEEFCKAYFSPTEGIGYTLGRIHMNSCDFSTDDYTCVCEGDQTLESFNIDRYKQDIIPMLKAASKYGKINLFLSPWTPPKYMKTNDDILGGHLKKEYYQLWAKYFKRFIEEFAKQGIEIGAVTIQNEPRHHQIWESCLYTPDEESEFLGYLGKELKGTGVKIFCYDHCRERIFERAKKIFDGENGAFCDGIANHWYSGDHFGEIEAVRTKYPSKLQMMSEGCCFDMESGVKKNNALSFGEAYAHDICGSIKAGLNLYCDWNLTLDEENGPCHHREGRNLVDAPVYCVESEDSVVCQPSYYYIGHFAKFIRPGAKCVAISGFSAELECCAFKNQDQSVAVVALNRTDRDIEFTLRFEDNVLKAKTCAHSIKTFLISE